MKANPAVLRYARTLTGATDTIRRVPPGTRGAIALRGPREILAVTAPDVIVPVHHGDATIQEVLAMAVVEPLIHTWDLAQAVGSPATLDEETVEVCLTATTPIAEQFATTGMYVPSLPIPEEATPE